MRISTSLCGDAKGARKARLPRLAWGLALLVGIVPLLLAGCAPQQADAAQLAADQTFTWPYYGATKINYGEMLDPASLSTLVDSGAIDMIYVGLVSLNGSLQPQPDAATSWKIDSTGTVYTFSLRHNMKFSDGTPLTATDFAYSIDRAVSSYAVLCQTPNVNDANSYGVNAPAGSSSCFNNGSTYLNYILGAAAKLSATSPNGAPSLISDSSNPNRGLTVIDPDTLQIKLTAPIPFFLDQLTYPTSYAVEKSLVENSAYAGGTWVAHLDTAGCSGPFKVSSYGDGGTLTLVPNPFWEDAWGKPLTLTKVGDRWSIPRMTSTRAIRRASTTRPMCRRLLSTRRQGKATFRSCLHSPRATLDSTRRRSRLSTPARSCQREGRAKSARRRRGDSARLRARAQ